MSEWLDSLPARNEEIAARLPAPLVAAARAEAKAHTAFFEGIIDQTPAQAEANRLNHNLANISCGWITADEPRYLGDFMPPAPRFPTMAAEHPKFDQATLPASLPEGFEDSTWCNDSCPSFINEGAGLILFIDCANPEDREYPECERISVGVWDDGATGETLIASDDWATVESFIASYRARKV